MITFILSIIAGIILAIIVGLIIAGAICGAIIALGYLLYKLWFLIFFFLGLLAFIPKVGKPFAYVAFAWHGLKYLPFILPAAIYCLIKSFVSPRKAFGQLKNELKFYWSDALPLWQFLNTPASKLITVMEVKNVQQTT